MGTDALSADGMNAAIVGTATPCWSTEPVNVYCADKRATCDICWHPIEPGHRFVTREVEHWKPEEICWSCTKASGFTPLPSPLDHRSEWLLDFAGRSQVYEEIILEKELEKKPAGDEE